MGQQQLLLILLGVIVIGAAVVIGMTLFDDNATSSNRDALSSDLTGLALRAQGYYRRPRVLGGGGNSFLGLTMAKLSSKPSNANGTYSVTSVSATQVVLDGVGLENGTDGRNLSVTMTVFADTIAIVLNN
jgi:hypothetical protein